MSVEEHERSARHSIFSGTLRVADERDLKGRWSGAKPGLRFRCGLCGHRFVAGDRWRGVMANVSNSPTRMGNFLVCGACHDGAGGADAALLAKRAEMEREAARRFWWLVEEDTVLEHMDRSLEGPKSTI